LFRFHSISQQAKFRREKTIVGNLTVDKRLAKTINFLYWEKIDSRYSVTAPKIFYFRILGTAKLYMRQSFPDTANLLFSPIFYPQLNSRQLFSLDGILPAVKRYGNETINLGGNFSKRVTLADLQPPIIFCIYRRGKFV
jgi:hypothetical protein